MTMTQNMKVKTYETKLDAFLKAVKALEADGIKMDITIEAAAKAEAEELHEELHARTAKLFDKYPVKNN